MLDVVSWDNYPQWHKGPERLVAMDNGMQHDIMRTLKKEPFILMESCPGPTNWQSVSKLETSGNVGDSVFAGGSAWIGQCHVFPDQKRSWRI